VSIAVEIDRLRDAIADFERAPYLLTTSDDGRPHSVAVAVGWAGDEIELQGGRRTAANAREHGLVALVWAPDDPTGYSLIVDGDVTAVSDDDVVRIRPTRAVLHRPAPPVTGREARTGSPHPAPS
jgi:hypothetical protein